MPGLSKETSRKIRVLDELVRLSELRLEELERRVSLLESHAHGGRFR